MIPNGKIRTRRGVLASIVGLAGSLGVSGLASARPNNGKGNRVPIDDSAAVAISDPCVDHDGRYRDYALVDITGFGRPSGEDEDGETIWHLQGQVQGTVEPRDDSGAIERIVRGSFNERGVTATDQRIPGGGLPVEFTIHVTQPNDKGVSFRRNIEFTLQYDTDDDRIRYRGHRAGSTELIGRCKA